MDIVLIEDLNDPSCLPFTQLLSSAFLSQSDISQGQASEVNANVTLHLTYCLVDSIEETAK